MNEAYGAMPSPPICSTNCPRAQLAFEDTAHVFAVKLSASCSEIRVHKMQNTHKGFFSHRRNYCLKVRLQQRGAVHRQVSDQSESGLLNGVVSRHRGILQQDKHYFLLSMACSPCNMPPRAVKSVGASTRQPMYPAYPRPCTRLDPANTL